MQGPQMSVKLDSMQRLQPAFALPIVDYVSRKISGDGEVGRAAVSYGSCCCSGDKTIQDGLELQFSLSRRVP